MRNKLIFIGMFIVACGIFGGLIVPQILKSKDQYSGKEVFNSESDYANFKQALVSSGATWDSISKDGGTYIQALSSSPPIIVDFNVNVKQDVHFSYGVKHSQIATNLIFGIVMFCMVIVLLYVISCFWTGDMGYLFRKSKDKMVNK